MIFSKPPRTPEYLAHKLIQSGLQGISESELTEVFQSINYYKLRDMRIPIKKIAWRLLLFYRMYNGLAFGLIIFLI